MTKTKNKKGAKAPEEFNMNEYMKHQIETMLVSIETFRTGIQLGATQDDGIIDKNEEKILKKTEKAADKFSAQLKKLLGE